ncbi:MAG: hypothetical protein WKF58_10485 [Ilumatobacteraceae bacterium]
MLGNHVIVDLGDQVYALYAHLRRRSMRLDPGQQMRSDLPADGVLFEVDLPHGE